LEAQLNNWLFESSIEGFRGTLFLEKMVHFFFHIDTSELCPRFNHASVVLRFDLFVLAFHFKRNPNLPTANHSIQEHKKYPNSQPVNFILSDTASRPRFFESSPQLKKKKKYSRLLLPPTHPTNQARRLTHS